VANPKIFQYQFVGGKRVSWNECVEERRERGLDSLPYEPFQTKKKGQPKRSRDCDVKNKMRPKKPGDTQQSLWGKNRVQNETGAHKQNVRSRRSKSRQLHADFSSLTSKTREDVPLRPTREEPGLCLFKKGGGSRQTNQWLKSLTVTALKTTKRIETNDDPKGEIPRS